MTALLNLLAEPDGEKPLRIGDTKQLFIDDYVVASRRGLARKLHHPDRYPGNPVLAGNEPWEKWRASPDGHALIYDEEAQEFKLYYSTNIYDEHSATGDRYRIGYAVSKDGVHWIKPVLGQVAWGGSGKNNLLQWGQNWMRRGNVIKDLLDPDPNRRFKMTYGDVLSGRVAIVKAYSADGINWKLNGDGHPFYVDYQNHNLMGWDPGIRFYVLYVRIASEPSKIGRSLSRDFVTWSAPEPILAPDNDEGGRSFKGLAAFLYNDLYLGFIWVFDRINDTEGKPLVVADAELAVSRNGYSWHRVSRDNYFMQRGAPGSWDWDAVLPIAPAIHNDTLWIYYAGWNMAYESKNFVRAETGWIENGQRMQEATGLATLRLDGFVSLDAGAQTGTLTTHLLQVPGGSLTVNAAVRGKLRVELLDQNNQSIAGYSTHDCISVHSDGLRQAIRWTSHPTLDELRGKAVKLRFLLQDGSLYAFQFYPNET